MSGKTECSRFVVGVMSIALCVSVLAIAGCSTQYRTCHYAGRIGAASPPARAGYYWRAPLCREYDDEPQSWVRIEGDVYTQSYLESLYRYQNGQ